jgi:hypothetical protein
MDESIDLSNPLKGIWDSLLGQKPEQIRSIFTTLSAGDQQAILVHLKKMVTEEGWHPEQRISAETALNAILIM